MVRVPVGNSDLLASINYFDLSKTTFKLFVQDLFLIVDLCVSYLLDKSLLILKLVLGCVSKLSVRHIQTVHTNFPPLHICGRLWRGYRFF